MPNLRLPSPPLVTRTSHSNLVLLSTGQTRAPQRQSIHPHRYATTPGRLGSVDPGVRALVVRITGPVTNLLDNRRLRRTIPASTPRCHRGQASTVARRLVNASSPTPMTTSRPGEIIRALHRLNPSSLPLNKAVALRES